MSELYEVDRAAKPSCFGHSPEEIAVLSENAVELLRCVADTGRVDGCCDTIEFVALKLDCTLMVTMLARVWAQFVMGIWERSFENDFDVLLEAALQLETADWQLETADWQREATR